MFEALRVIAEKRGGNPNVPRSHPTHGEWLTRQRVAYKNGKLAADRVQALKELGVWWIMPRGRPRNDAKWRKKLKALRKIAAKRGGDPNVPQNHPTHGIWLMNQRTFYNAGKLTADRVQALEELGVRWVMPCGRPVDDVKWWKKLKVLRKIAAKRGGDPNVSQRHPTHGVWLHSQRTIYKAGKLAADRVQALEELGVRWVMPCGIPRRR